MERIHFRFWGNVFFSNIRCTVWLTICRKKHMISSDRTCAINKSSCVSIWHWHLLNQTKFQKILWRRLIVVLIEIFYQIRNTFYISWTVTFSTFFEHWFRLTKMSCIYPDSLYSHSLNCLYILCIHWKNFFWNSILITWIMTMELLIKHLEHEVHCSLSFTFNQFWR